MAVAKSGVEGKGVEAAYEKSITAEGKRSLSDGQKKRTIGNPATSLGPARVANSFVSRVGEAFTMCGARGPNRRFRIPQGGNYGLIVAAGIWVRALVFIRADGAGPTRQAVAQTFRGHDSWNSHGRDRGWQCPAQR